MTSSAQTSNETTVVALVYDFDGTLAKGSIQEHSLLPSLGLTPEAFWPQVDAQTKRVNADGILMYMQRILAEAKDAGTPVTKAMLRKHGAHVPFFPGVEDWFARINQYALENFGVELHHYIVSSGNTEIIQGTAIAKEFKRIFASKYLFDESDEAAWPAVAVNYTTKTQFLFRISKGIDNYWDNESLNRRTEKSERAYSFSQMIFLGDGDTDIPSFELLREQGGHALAVFDPDAWVERSCQEKVHKLIAEDRVTYATPGDYSEGSLLDIVLKGMIQRISQLDM